MVEAVSSRKYNIEKGITRGHVPLSGKKKKIYNSLWTQKFGKRIITSDNDLRNVIAYIRNNRQKHELPENRELEKLINEITCSV